MSAAKFRVAPLDAEHNRATFSSGSEPLDRYFQLQVTQDVRRRVTACFVALTSERRIAGYYTLAAASILLNDLPSSIGKKLPRYPLVPAVRMGRLAVDQKFKGLGLGGALLADAMNRAVHSEIAAYAMVVDANGHGKDVTPDNETRHARFPLSNFPPQAGERANESLREIHVKDKKAAAFYQHHGFIPLPDSPLTLFLPLATVATI